MKYQPRTKPFQHQTRATLKAVRKRNFAVFFDPRLGKSKVALDYAGILALKGEVRKVLILAPAIALDVWRRELHKHFPYNYTLEDFDYEYPSRGGGEDGPHLHFFLAGREETFRAVRASTNLERPKQRELEEWSPDVIIVDESHQYKRPGGRAAQDAWRLVRRLRKRNLQTGERKIRRTASGSLQDGDTRSSGSSPTKSRRSLNSKAESVHSAESDRPSAWTTTTKPEKFGGCSADLATAHSESWEITKQRHDVSSSTSLPPKPYVLLLSGTPNPKGWRDLFAQFRVMDETLLGTNAGSFDERYVLRGQGRRKWTILGYNKLPELKEIIAQNSIACTARQAGLEGKLFWQVLPVELPQKARETYDELAEEYIVQTAHGTIDAANQGVLRLRLLQVTSGFAGDLDDGGRKHTLHDAKVKAVRAYAANLFDQGESLVVYSRFTAEVDAYYEVLERVGYKVRAVDGRTKRRDRDTAIKRFQDGRLTALVFQYQAGNLAIELTAAAEVLFTTLPDGWADFFQCLNRVRGPNQHRPVRISALVATNTVDRHVLASLRKKADWHSEVMRDPAKFLYM